jgi:hypothetical protein
MAKLTANDREQLLAFTQRGWRQTVAERSSARLAQTPEARMIYCRWATSVAAFAKAAKPVRFCGDQWKL